MRLFILVAGLALAGCGPTPMSKAEEANDLADAAQANARTALGRLEEMEGRVSDLEDENRSLKVEIASRESEIATLRAEFEAYKEDSVQWHHKHGGY